MTRRLIPVTFLAALAFVSTAVADPRVTVTPKVARPGDAVLVTVTGTKVAPEGDAGGVPLRFFAARRGFQAVFAVRLDAKPEPIAVDVAGVGEPAMVKVKAATFPDVAVAVEEEMANPPKPERDRIDADNKAILDVVTSPGAPQFVKPFLRPRGKVSSTFGEWRTFNDGHRSQHLGLDLAARGREDLRDERRHGRAGARRLPHRPQRRDRARRRDRVGLLPPQQDPGHRGRQGDARRHHRARRRDRPHDRAAPAPQRARARWLRRSGDVPAAEDHARGAEALNRRVTR
jgi:hypothetical protein